MSTSADSKTFLDPSRCPLCGKQNLCAMEIERGTGQKQAPCWCTTASFDASLLARIPAEKRHLACICAACAAYAAQQAD